MRKINMSTVKFIVKPEARKVICLIEDCKNDFTDFIMEKTPLSHMLNFWELHSQFLMSDTYTGVATCMEGDEWNEEIGKRIALNKAERKWGNAFFRKANTLTSKIYEDFIQGCDTIDAFGVQLGDKLARCEKKVSDYFEKCNN
jgi:hypothetical protein